MWFVRHFGVAWGTIGVLGLLLFAVYRLAPRAMEAYDGGLTVGQWALAAAICVFMAYAEGYRGFQLKFSPRTAARIRYLRDNPDPVRALFAPLFAIGYFHATRGTRIRAYALSLGIVALVLLVHRLDQPWRGLIDAGVVVGLAWGIVSIVGWVARALTQATFAASPEVPDP
jgi:cytochrome bd-type quinol oxidase subunit 1